MMIFIKCKPFIVVKSCFLTLYETDLDLNLRK